MMNQWYIKELSDLVKVSVRTLHHYDHVGLLKPSIRQENGYRLYSEGDLIKLQQILALKSFGFGLEQIKSLLQPQSNLLENMRGQAKYLQEKIEVLAKAQSSLNSTLAKAEKEKEVSLKTIIKSLEAFNMIKEQSTKTPPFAEVMLRKTYPNSSDEEIAALLKSATESSPCTTAEGALAWKNKVAFFDSYYLSKLSEDEREQFVAAKKALIQKISDLLELDPTSEAGANVASEWVNLQPYRETASTTAEQVAKELAQANKDYEELSENDQLGSFLATYKSPTVPAAVLEWIGKAIVHHHEKIDVDATMREYMILGLDWAMPNLAPEEREMYLRDIDRFIQTEPKQYLPGQFGSAEYMRSQHQMMDFISEYLWSRAAEDDYKPRKAAIDLLLKKIENSLDKDPNSAEAEVLANEYNEFLKGSVCKNPWIAEMNALFAYKKALNERTVQDFLAPHKRPFLSDTVRAWISKAVLALNNKQKN